MLRTKIIALTLAAAFVFTGCSCGKKVEHSKSVISPETVEQALIAKGAVKADSEDALGQAGDSGSYFKAEGPDEIAALKSDFWGGKPEATYDEVVIYRFNKEAEGDLCKLSLVAFRMETDESARAFFNKCSNNASTHMDSKAAIESTASSINMSVPGSEDYNPDSPASNLLSDGYLISHEYVFFYTLELESGKEETQNFITSLFDQIGIEAPQQGEISVIV